MKKTWLILISLAISVTSSFAQVEYCRTNEAGTPLPIQDAETEDLEQERTTYSKDSEKGMLSWLWSLVKKKVAYDRTNEAESPQEAETEDPELERIETTPNKDSEKGMLARLWSFVKKDSSDDQKMEAEPLLPSQAPLIEQQEGIKWESVTPIFLQRDFLKFRTVQEEDLTDVDLSSKDIRSMDEEKWTEEARPLSPHHNHTLPSQDTSTKKNEDAEKEKSHEVEGKGEDDASKKPSLSEGNCQGCLSATERLSGNPTTPEPLLTTEGTTTPRVPPRRNPWATCDHSTPEMERKVAAALTEFALNFYKKATEFERDSNIVFSPISISVILSNLLLGACGETKEHLEKLLSYPEDVPCVHAALKNFQKSEALALASAIFYQPTLTLNDEFRNLSDKFYQSKIQHLTNDSHQDVTDINAWVSKNTDHKIKKLLDDLEPDVQMVLLNAVFLRAKWKTMFKKTIKEEFFRPGLPTISVPMMTSKKYPVAAFVDNSLQAKVGQLQLSHNMSLIIIMPRYLSQNLSEVEKQLDAVVLMSVMSKLKSMPFRPTIVTLPKFKVASSQDLISIVQRLDYGIFYETDLCGISEEEVAVTSALHKAVLEINEEGVEGAAATAISLARTANVFSVQQPFIFMVSKNNEFPVFLGRIHNPKSS